MQPQKQYFVYKLLDLNSITFYIGQTYQKEARLKYYQDQVNKGKYPNQNPRLYC